MFKRNRSQRSFPRCMALCLSMTLTAATALAQEQRTWSDLTGQNKLQAEFVALNGAKVKLKSPDGKTYEIEVAKLSPEDRAYLVNLPGANPFKPVNRGQAGQVRAPAVELEEPSDEVLAGRPRAAAPPKDLKHGRKIDLKEKRSGGWSYDPHGVDRLDFVPRFAKFSQTRAGMINEFEVARSGGFGAVGSGQETLNLCVVDFRTGQVTASLFLPSHYHLLSIDEDGQRLAVAADLFHNADKGRLKILVVEGQTLRVEAEWTPFSDGTFGPDTVTWAAFVGETRLAVLSRGGRLSVWNLASLREDCYFDLDTGAIAAASPDRDVIAVADSTTGVLFDIKRRQILGSGALPRELKPRSMAFNAGGDRLVVSGQGPAVLVNTADGSRLGEISTPGTSNTDVRFAGDNYLLVGGVCLVEIASQLRLWTYQASWSNRVSSAGQYTFFVVDDQVDGGSNGALAMELPDLQAREYLNLARQSPDSFALHPNMAVKIDLSTIPADQQASVRESLTRELQRIEITVGEASDVVLAARVEGPTPKQVEFHTYHVGGNEKHTVNEYISIMEVLYRGQPVWKRSETNIPFQLRMGEHQSVQSALAEQVRGPNLGLFQWSRLPQFIPKPEAKSSSGERSRIGYDTLGVTTINEPDAK